MDNVINYALYRFSIYGNANSINASGEDYIGIYGDCNTNDGGYSNYVYGYGNSIQGGYENYVYGSYNQVRSGHLNTILGTSILVSDDSDENILIGKKFDAAHALGLIAIISNGNNAVINKDGVIIAHEWAPEVGQSGYIHILNDEVNINGNVFINGADISQLVRAMVISTLNELPSSEE